MKTLGDGNFAIVKQAKNKMTEHEYAIKIIDKSKMKGKENMIDNEIYIMKSCNHPNIVKLHEEFETKSEVYLVTDLVKVR
jgi:serine/threonine protein kinase